ncbi:GspH/FimT family pseudopilin [Nitrosomonas sp.]|uniref:GspH/FimT family pseudopilin n=1 Tax=Nitrosomonas sp. TaxID=42353 RepID=UPI0025DC78F8|nr:GspH/FimT family pseudopilin [Nitrosomonas sp.]
MTETNSKGFTLVELMITISIASILLAVAVPDYQSIMRESRLTTQANELMTSLHYARSEAVKRGIRVTICKSSDSASCTNGSNWQDGWLIFSDTGTAGSVDGTDEILRVFPKMTGSTLNGGSNFGNWVSYLPSGRSQGNGNLPNGMFGLCNQANGRNIIINTSGRPRVEKVSSC